MNKTLFKILITLLIICSLPFGKGWGWATYAQNLVPNPSFEGIDSCYTFWTIDDWYAPTTGTADFYPGCMIPTYPNVGSGYQYARTGNSYAGIITYEIFNTINNSREYIQTKLINPLQAGVKYKVSFYVNLANYYSSEATNMMGAYLSNTPIGSTNFNVLNYTPQIVETAVIIDTLNWIEISGEYTAAGGEEYITVGCFMNDGGLSIIHVNDSTPFNYALVYYYVDDVSIIAKDSSTTVSTDSITDNVIIPNVITPNKDGINDIFLLNFSYESMIIYNRWGQQLFISNNNESFWNGRTTSGNEVPDGTYYYIIVTEEGTYKGYLQLLR